MKFSIAISGFILSVLFLQVNSLVLAKPNQHGREGGYQIKRHATGPPAGYHQNQIHDAPKKQPYGGGYQKKQIAPKKSHENNFYNVGTASSKRQNDGASNSAHKLNKQDVKEFQKVDNNKWISDERKDNFAERSNFKDDLYNQRNTKAHENDDLDKNRDSLRYAKSNKNKHNDINKIHYKDARDDIDKSDLKKFNENRLRKNNANNSKHQSNAYHGESTDNVMTNTGLSAPSYGKHHSGKGNAPSHYSRKQHQQKHNFGNADEQWNKNDFESGSKNRINKIAFKQRRNNVNFDKDDRKNSYNDNNLDFAKKNDNLKRRSNKDYKDTATNKRNVARNHDINKNHENKSNKRASNLAVNSKKLQRIDKKDKKYDQDHQFSAKDSRAKKITNDHSKGRKY